MWRRGLGSVCSLMRNRVDLGLSAMSRAPRVSAVGHWSGRREAVTPSQLGMADRSCGMRREGAPSGRSPCCRCDSRSRSAPGPARETGVVSPSTAPERAERSMSANRQGLLLELPGRSLSSGQCRHGPAEARRRERAGSTGRPRDDGRSQQILQAIDGSLAILPAPCLASPGRTRSRDWALSTSCSFNIVEVLV